MSNSASALYSFEVSSPIPKNSIRCLSFYSFGKEVLTLFSESGSKKAMCRECAISEKVHVFTW